jgi:hypothetical protein
VPTFWMAGFCCELFVAVDSVEMSMSLDRLDDLVLLI